MLWDRSPEFFHLAKVKLYTHLTATPHLMPSFNHFSITLAHGLLQKCYPVSAVAMNHRKGVLTQIWPQVLNGLRQWQQRQLKNAQPREVQAQGQALARRCEFPCNGEVDS